MIFIAYCAGNAAGPAFVYEQEAPGYKSAAAAMMGGYTGKLICHCLLGYYVSRVPAFRCFLMLVKRLLRRLTDVAIQQEERCSVWTC